MFQKILFWKNGLIFEGYKRVTKQLGGAENSCRISRN